jgi:hypothetical protein
VDIGGRAHRLWVDLGVGELADVATGDDGDAVRLLVSAEYLHDDGVVLLDGQRSSPLLSNTLSSRLMPSTRS